jgi:hypothetical protein
MADRAPNTDGGEPETSSDTLLDELVRALARQAAERIMRSFGTNRAPRAAPIAGVELLHFRELLFQSGQLVAQAKVFRVPFSVFGRAGRLNLALVKGTPRAQMG